MLHVYRGVRTSIQTLPHCRSIVRTRPQRFLLLHSRDFLLHFLEFC